MTERPLLSLPEAKRSISTGKPATIQEVVRPLSSATQEKRLGPKFERLSRALPDPQFLAALRNDPAAIVPERALVFEIASEIVDFDRARRNIPGLEPLGEDQDEVSPDEDFIIDGKPEKKIRRRIYFTMPDKIALQEIVSLWKLYQQGKNLGYGRGEWKKIFAHLADIRPWGPQDRVTAEARTEWSKFLKEAPDKPIKLEVEFWFRTSPTLRDAAHQSFQKIINDGNGSILDRTTIHEINYDAVLIQLPSKNIQEILNNPDIGLASFDEIMILRPQSLVIDPQITDFEDSENILDINLTSSSPLMRAALLDGLPMAQHAQLSGKLSIDDPDDFTSKYSRADEQIHGTSMASLIINGDLNISNPNMTIKSQLYVRPVMFPQEAGFDGRRFEMMPSDQLALDLIWQCFIRMFSRENGNAPTAPDVKIVNLSLGDSNQRFSGRLSPWARLIDYLSWEYNILVIISAGNISDSVLLENVSTWSEFEKATKSEREEILLNAIIRQRATRSLLAPSESVNALTVGAAHADAITSTGSGMMAIDPYASSCLPNLSSALGLGYLRGAKPEILLPGGCEHIRASSSHAPISVTPVDKPGRYFGIGSATPGIAGDLTRKANFSGTSVATALATHSALKIIESFEESPEESPYPSVNDEFYAVVIKSLLVHAAKWDINLSERIKKISKDSGNSYWEHQREDITRFLGFGAVNIDQVLECTSHRATMIGWNTIRTKEVDEYRIPLPTQLEGLRGFRSVTATIGWITPLNANKRSYRLVKFAIEPGGDKNLSLGVDNSKHQPPPNAFGRGTIYQRRWEGTEARSFVDGGDLVLKVICKSVGGEIVDEAIPYGIAISLEVGEDVDVPVYEEVRTRLRQIIRPNVQSKV